VVDTTLTLMVTKLIFKTNNNFTPIYKKELCYVVPFFYTKNLADDKLVVNIQITLHQKMDYF
jgi:hypothetical protein